MLASRYWLATTLFGLRAILEVAVCHPWGVQSEWVAVALTLVGFLGSLGAAWFARKERIAAGTSADLAHAVQEEMAASQAAIAAALTRPKVMFESVPHSIRTFVLRNKGPETATDLVIDWPDWIWVVNDEVPTSLAPGECIEFGGAGRRLREERETSMLVACAQLPGGMRVPLPSF